METKFPKTKEGIAKFLGMTPANLDLLIDCGMFLKPQIVKGAPRWIAGDYIDRMDKLTGKVYFAVIHDLIKIGHTKDVEDRMRGLARQHETTRPRLLLTIGGNVYVESYLHTKFADLRMHDEFFRPEQPLTDYIETLRFRP